MKVIFGFLFVFFSISSACAQKVEGTWLTQGGAAKVQIYKMDNGLYEGKLIWTKDQSEKIQQTHGSTVIRRLKKVEDKKYEGIAYDPERKKEFSCTVTITGENSLDLRGYIGISLLGKTEKWTRIPKSEK